MDVLSPWDIVVIPFPYVEVAEYERRPAVIISGAVDPEGHALHWVLMITGKNKTKWEGDIAIPQYQELGLNIPSIIRCGKVAAVSAKQVAYKLGALPVSLRPAVTGFLQSHLTGILTP